MKLGNFSTEFRKVLKCQISWKSFQCEPSCSVWTDRRTDMMKIIVAFRNFGKAPNKSQLKKGKIKGRATAKNPECRFSRSTFYSLGETAAWRLVKPSSFACVILIFGTQTQAIRAMCVSLGDHLPAVVSSRWPNHSYVRLLIIIGFQFGMAIMSPLGDTRPQVIAVCCVLVKHKPLKANSHIPCRSHAAPMPFPCHTVPLRV
jgi:hypothetical protein